MLFHGAIPTVITGKNHKLISMVKGPKIAIPFKIDVGSFIIEICLEKKYLRDNFTLDDLFIRSFPISTKSWSSERLKEIYGDIQRFLFISYFKKHSLQFTTTIVKKFLRNPVKFLKHTVAVHPHSEKLGFLQKSLLMK